MSKKLTFEYVKNEIEKEGYSLVSTEYKNIKTNLELTCREGHTCNISVARFERGQRCSICAGTKKYTLDQVREEIESAVGYKLLSEEYTSNGKRLEIKCPEGHVIYPSFSSFKSGCRCLTCSGKEKHTLDFVDKRGFTLKTNQAPRGGLSNIEVVCNKGHLFKVRFCDFKKKGNCPQCLPNFKYTEEQAVLFFNKEKYTVLFDKYVNASQKLDTICPEGHKGKISTVQFIQGQRCPQCNRYKTEKMCRKIFEDTLQKNFLASEPDFLLLKNKRKLQLDGYNSELKLAFEYDGEFHYKEVGGLGNNPKKQQERDKIKDELCKLNNVYLIRIPYFVEDKKGFIAEEITIWKTALSGTND